MAMKWINKDVRTLRTHGLPFKYNFKFWSESEFLNPQRSETETFTQDVQQVLYVDITFQSGCHPNITQDFTLENIYIFYPIDTPFSPPTIMFQHEFTHPCIIDGQLNVDGWSPAISLSQLLCNVYLIYLESLDLKNEIH